MASLLSSELKSTNERTYCKDRIIHIAYLLCEYGQNEPALKSMVEDALSNDVLPYLR